MRLAMQSFAVLAAIVALAPTPAPADAVQAGRYTLVVTAPSGDQLDPLSAIVTVSFPRALVATVGDAVTSLLTRSGYRLVPDAASLPLTFPLPDVQRRFDNLRVRDILAALGGTGYALRVEPASRTVGYELRPEYAAAVPPAAPAGAPAPAAPQPEAPEPPQEMTRSDAEPQP
jgi:type IV pili sensor histidine kinase/response regulator